MYRTLHLVPLLLLAAAPVAAQQTIRPGQTVSGQLTASDPTLNDGSHYDVWRFAAVARHRYRVTLRSDDFDAYLAVGSSAMDDCGDCATDDDGAGGTDARVEFTGGEDGTYEIRANSYLADEMGGYELALEDQGVVEDGAGHDHEAAEMGTPITVGEQVTGELARTDRKTGSSYSDTWSYMGRRGETIIVTLRSEDFDAYLTAGAFEGGECQEMDSNDNGGGGHDARLRVRLPEDGAYHIHVSAHGQGATGAYTLLVEHPAPREPGPPPMPISPGETLQGRLAETDQVEDDGSFSDAWTFRGSAGERFTITLQSSDFDAFLRLGRISGDEFMVLDTDDDGGGDTNSRIVITLPEDGEYVIHAGSYDDGETGDYTLRVERR
jgi:hypothetical protein